MDKVLSIFDWLRKTPTGFLLAICIVLGMLVFLPDGVADKLAVKDFRISYRMYLGPALLLAVSFLLTKLAMSVGHSAQARKNVRNRVEQLSELTAEEKGYLSQFVLDGGNTIYVAFGDGVAGGLLAKGIIYQSSDVVNVLQGFPYNLQSWARNELLRNPHLLDGAVGRPVTNMERLFGDRL